MVAPASNLTEKKPAGGFLKRRPSGIPVYLFCSSKGPFTAQPFGAHQQDAIAAMFGAGPVRQAGYCASQSSSQCVCVRVPATARAATKSALTITSATMAGFGALSGTPTDGADVVVTCSTTGTTGSGFAYTVTVGGVTGAPVTVTTGLTIVALGVTLTLTTGKVITAGDTFAWLQRMASASVSPITVTKAGSSSATYAVTGTPADAYSVRVEWLTSGTLATAGITGRYALDWDGVDGTWVTFALGTGLTLLPLDGVDPSGLTLTAATTGSGTIDAGDYLEFHTTGPEAQWSDISAALTALRATSLAWSFVATFNPLSATDAGSLDTLLGGWATGTRRAWSIADTRDREFGETIAAWRTRLLADYASFTSTRVFPAAGMAPCADPVTGRRNRRGAVVDYVTRATTATISDDLGAAGALPASRALHDSTGQPREYDADADSSLFDRGFLTLRTFESDNLPGTYCTGSVCMPPAGDLGLVQLRRVLDAFENALQDQATLELNGKFRRWTVPQTAGQTTYKAGDIREADARAIENRLKRAAFAAVMAGGDASGITVTLNRTPVSMGGGKFNLLYTGLLEPLGYIYQMDGTVQLEDPAFAA